MLTNMKLSAEEAKEITSPEPGDGPRYPYGLRVSLDDDSIKKLGITELPAIGTPFMLMARVEVCSTADYASQDSDDHRSIDLQITDLAVEPEAKESDRYRLYPTMQPSE